MNTGIRGFPQGRLSAADGTAEHSARQDNPHNTTATQVGKDTPQWNSDRLQDITVSSSSPTLNHVLTYDGTQWVSATPPGAGGGEANTASNVGTSGLGLFKQKTGVNLEFKKIKAGTNITLSATGNDEVEIAASGGGAASVDILALQVLS